MKRRAPATDVGTLAEREAREQLLAVREAIGTLGDEYRERVANAKSGHHVNELVREYAAACLARLDDLEGQYVEREREAFRLMLEQTEPLTPA